ncbi:hypothetical protein [Lentzea sp. NPDC003310]|uniref:hypothetical protein n=1 Tax=Lentzea sp. NPDC003310 TaxID=3154447 RepID=UPI0033AE076E
MARGSLVEAVADELDRVARSGRDRSSLDLPELRKIAERTVPGPWDAAALDRLLRAGAEALGGSFGTVSESEAALVLFGLDADPAPDHERAVARVRGFADVPVDGLVRALAAALAGQGGPRIKVEPRDNLVSMLSTFDTDEPPGDEPRKLKARTVALVIGTAVVVTVGATLVVTKLMAGDGSEDLRTVSGASTPLKVQDVTRFQTSERHLRYVLSEVVAEPPPQAPANGAEATGENFGAWYAKHGGTVLRAGFTNITVQGNDSAPVRITDMKIRPDCSAPVDGTHLLGYTQGGERDTIKIGFNLDSSDPIPEQMTTLDGMRGTGLNYFAAKTVELGPGEVEVLTVGVFTERRHCKFTLQFVVATSNGTVLQDVDAPDKGFAVTGYAAAKSPDAPYSGYRKVYRQDATLGWNEVDPNAREGR